MYIDMFLCGTETVIILVKEVVLIVNPVGARESIVKERKGKSHPSNSEQIWLFLLAVCNHGSGSDRNWNARKPLFYIM